MKPDDFEKRLQSQPMRQIPSEWRQQILQGAKQSTPSTAAPMARRSEAKAVRPSRLSTLIHQLSAVLWLKPAAWAGLAVVWVVIFALQSTSQKHSGMVATVSARAPSTFLMSFKDEQQTLAELMGNNQPNDLDQRRHAGPKPRSELRSRYRVV
jgi:hypothetical protein